MAILYTKVNTALFYMKGINFVTWGLWNCDCRLLNLPKVTMIILGVIYILYKYLYVIYLCFVFIVQCI